MTRRAAGPVPSHNRRYRPTSVRAGLWALAFVAMLSLRPYVALGDGDLCLNDTGQPRVTVVLFQYAGTEHGDEVKNFFSRFRLMLQRQLETIPGDIAYRSIGSVDLNTLRVFFAGPDTIQNLADRTDYSSRDGILEVLRGDVQRVGQRFQVTSYVFLGERKGKLTRPEIAISMPIHTAAYANTRDGFTLISTYALAVDAHLRQCPGPLVTALLDSARNRITTIEARGGEREPAFDDVKRAIQVLEMELSN